MKVDNYPSIIIDNKTGVRNSVIYLIEKHKYRNIAYIKGPRLNQESELRYSGYSEVLKELGIKEDPDLIDYGDFGPITGAAAFHR